MKTKFGLAVLLIILIIASCKRKDVSNCEGCLNGGYCVSDTCQCTTGYEGKNCETKTSLKFLGNYNVSDSGTFSWTSCLSDPKYQVFDISRTHTSTIYEGTHAGEIVISNYFGDGAPVTAMVKGTTLSFIDEPKITYGTGAPYSTDICFLNQNSYPKGTWTTMAITDSTGTIMDTVITITMNGYCYTDLGSCGNEIKQTTCKSIFTKTP